MDQTQPDTSSIEPPDKSALMNALVAEFKAAKAEIMFRASSQSTLMQLNITAAGTVVGFVFANKADPLTLVVIPILSPVLGILWIDHHQTIIKLGNFIKGMHVDYYNKAVGFPFPDYQNYKDAADMGGSSKLVIYNFIIAVFITFGFLPAAVLVYAAFQVPNAFSANFLAPAVLAIALLLMFISQFISRFLLSTSDPRS